MHLEAGILSALVTFIVTIGPVETAVIFAGLTSGVHRADRRKLAARAVLIAGGMLGLFAIGGGLVLSWLHISLPAFRVAGGVLLFLQALSLTFSNPGMSSIDEGERREAKAPGDIAVFPLAFPLIAGPGSLAAAVLVMGRTTTWMDAAAVLAVLSITLAATYGAMRLAERLVGWLGRTGADVVGRVSGVLLAGLAVQFIFDGLRQAALFSNS
ncbi:MarC family protein [Brevundimonas goettingensis]|uniref:UPF0056 membrane protein n=1 Tax=Brevundimonas goettingensis TaxID=2774190 RepID=A0A975BYQ1_9CAUL|nr:MarC family protein [Brevundimonas goettingensis]QTC90288.1 MarC family protein [Brevundimonas goettingensis]